MDDKIISGALPEPVSQTVGKMERFDWLFIRKETLDEDTSRFLMRRTMSGNEWICWQVMEPWW
jgi:hypothetical protein